MAICSNCKKTRYETPCEHCGSEEFLQKFAKEGTTGGGQPDD